MPPLLDVRNLYLHYADRRGDVRAVDGISFTLAARGQALGIVGESGSGKSSLALAIMRVLPENVARFDGEVYLDGQEIAQMAEWRKAWYPTAGEKLMMWHAESNHMMAMTPEFRRNMMMSVDLGKADDKFDLRFLDAMIPHHEGALVMAKDAIAKSKRPEIQKMAQEILSSQQAEIDQMKQLRK